MQIVITIDDKDYNDIMTDSPRNLNHYERLIANGIPLPKGHGDLKDQKDLAKSLYDYQWIDQLTYIEVTNRLINTPTIIAEDKEQEDGNDD